MARIDADGRTVLIPTDSGGLRIVRPSALRAGKSPKLAPGTRIRSQLAYFADAYAAVRRGAYPDVVARFLAMADRYPVEKGVSLPDFSYAAAKTGDEAELETLISANKSEEDLDLWLARAYFAGVRKDSNAAHAALQRAFVVRPHPSRPTLTEYQFAEASSPAQGNG